MTPTNDKDLTVPKLSSDSQRLDKIIDILEKIDWKLWEIYQKVEQGDSDPAKIVKKVVKK